MTNENTVILVTSVEETPVHDDAGVEIGTKPSDRYTAFVKSFEAHKVAQYRNEDGHETVTVFQPETEDALLSGIRQQRDGSEVVVIERATVRGRIEDIPESLEMDSTVELFPSGSMRTSYRGEPQSTANTRTDDEDDDVSENIIDNDDLNDDAATNHYEADDDDTDYSTNVEDDDVDELSDFGDSYGYGQQVSDDEDGDDFLWGASGDFQMVEDNDTHAETEAALDNMVEARQVDRRQHTEEEIDVLSQQIQEMLPDKDAIMSILNTTGLDVEIEPDTPSVAYLMKANQEASLLSLQSEAIRSINRMIRNGTLDEEIERMQEYLRNNPPESLNTFVDSIKEQQRIQNEVTQNIDSIRENRIRDKEEYLQMALEELRERYEEMFPDDTDARIMEYVVSVTNQMDAIEATVNENRTQAASDFLAHMIGYETDSDLAEVIRYHILKVDAENKVTQMIQALKAEREREALRERQMIDSQQAALVSSVSDNMGDLQDLFEDLLERQSREQSLKQQEMVQQQVSQLESTPEPMQAPEQEPVQAPIQTPEQEPTPEPTPEPTSNRQSLNQALVDEADDFDEDAELPEVDEADDFEEENVHLPDADDTASDTPEPTGSVDGTPDVNTDDVADVENESRGPSTSDEQPELVHVESEDASERDDGIVSGTSVRENKITNRDTAGESLEKQRNVHEVESAGVVRTARDDADSLDNHKRTRLQILLISGGVLFLLFLTICILLFLLFGQGGASNGDNGNGNGNDVIDATLPDTTTDIEYEPVREGEIIPIIHPGDGATIQVRVERLLSDGSAIALDSQGTEWHITPEMLIEYEQRNNTQQNESLEGAEETQQDVE